MLILTSGPNKNIVIRNADGSDLITQIISVADERIRIALSAIDLTLPQHDSISTT